MSGARQDRVFAACGIASVALQLGGFVVGAASGGATVTLASSPAKVGQAFANPVGTGVWVGAYIGLLSFAAFLAFAVWATARLGGGLIGGIARTAATTYAALGIAAWCVLDALEFRAGHGMSTQLTTALSNVNEALYVGSWFPGAVFLLAAGTLALTAARRALGWSAIAAAVVTLAGAAAPMNDLVQNTIVLWFIWIVWASISLARDERVSAEAVAVA